MIQMIYLFLYLKKPIEIKLKNAQGVYLVLLAQAEAINR